MLARNATPDELGRHPDIVAAHSEVAKRRPTTELPGYGTPEFYLSRTYTLEDRRQLKGRAAVVHYVAEQSEKASTDGPVRNDRMAIIILGPPASGKSTVAKSLARRDHAAIIDSDDAKPLINGYDGGIGAGAVQDESSQLIFGLDGVLDLMTDRGANVIIPRVGGNTKELRELVNGLNTLGYEVKAVSIVVDPDEAFRRMIVRSRENGRIIGEDYMRSIGNKPSETYHQLKKEGLFNESVEIDGNGPASGPRQILDGSETELGAFLRSGGD